MQQEAHPFWHPSGGRCQTNGPIFASNKSKAPPIKPSNRPGDPRPWVVDWQTAAWGPAAADVGYLLGGSLLAEDRRRHADRLLGVYHRALADHGVSDYGLDRLAEDVRHLCFSGLLMSIGASMLVKRTERGDELFVTSVARYAQQALDLALQHRNDGLATELKGNLARYQLQAQQAPNPGATNP